MHQTYSLLFALACCEFKNKPQLATLVLEPFGGLVSVQRGCPRLAVEPWLCRSARAVPGTAVPEYRALRSRRGASFCRGQRGMAIPSKPRVPALLCCLVRCSLVLSLQFPWFSSLLCSHTGGITCSGIPSWELLQCGWWPGPLPSLEKFSSCLGITSWKYHHGNYLLFCQASVWWKKPWEVYLPQEQYLQIPCKNNQTYFELNAISSLCLCSFCSGNV